MTIMTLDFWTALFSIVILDLVLAGDNAVVIAMAAHRLPDELKKKAVLVGTAGAVVIRIIMTLLAVYLLSIPYLQALGGLLLLPIAIKLLAPAKEGHVEEADNFAGAVKTIIVADAAMGIDNVLAVAGAAHGSFLLVVIGLVISVPIVVGSSQIIGKLLDNWPVLIYLGAGILGWTGGSMLVHDASIGPVIVSALGSMASIIIPAVLAVGVCVIGYSKKKQVQPD
ncbi:TerC family protein [Anaerovibrio lipolyticus]|uniref:Membrane protein n=1 Tax=Anaerovibrio lipolyticus TaxID=82374 RepID=A0A0B2JXV4_9FIRM|nr:TerC family protein [Anaerovibrio lipolyticus]KHM51486.1 membrane protein [Anaerovibrio lipolyticus]MBE6105008.1 TerC family protein [Anaerovibrio lipolyticus]HCP95593.1 TerC family protein [Anaerovibrio sp.]